MTRNEILDIVLSKCTIDIDNTGETRYTLSSEKLDNMVTKLASNTEIIGGVMVCPNEECENPYPHRYKTHWECEECGNKWGEA